MLAFSLSFFISLSLPCFPWPAVSGKIQLIIVLLVVVVVVVVVVVLIVSVCRPPSLAGTMTVVE